MAVQPPTPSVKAPTVVTTSQELSPVIIEAQRILKEMVAQIPKSVTGIERQMMISDMMTRTDETTETAPSRDAMSARAGQAPPR